MSGNPTLMGGFKPLNHYNECPSITNLKIRVECLAHPALSFLANATCPVENDNNCCRLEMGIPTSPITTSLAEELEGVPKKTLLMGVLLIRDCVSPEKSLSKNYLRNLRAMSSPITSGLVKLFMDELQATDGDKGS